MSSELWNREKFNQLKFSNAILCHRVDFSFYKRSLFIVQGGSNILPGDLLRTHDPLCVLALLVLIISSRDREKIVLEIETYRRDVGRFVNPGREYFSAFL